MNVQIFYKESIESHTSDINCLKLTDSNLFSGSGDKTIRAFSNIDNKLIEKSFSPLIGHKYYVNALALNSLELILASGSTDGNIILWSTYDGKKIKSLSHSSKTGIRSLYFSLNSQFLVSGSEDGSVCIWENSGRNWTLFQTLWEHDGCCNMCLVSPDSEIVVTGSTNGDIRIWECKRINLISFDGRQKAINSNSLSLLSKTDSHDLGVFGGAMSPVFEILPNLISYTFVTCGGDDLLKIWRLRVPRKLNSKEDFIRRQDQRSHRELEKGVDLTKLKILRGHSRIVTCCEYSVDGNIIISVSMDHYLIVWDAIRGIELTSVEVENNYVNTCSLSCDCSLVVTGGNGPSIKLWSMEYEKPVVPELQEIEKFEKVLSKESKLDKFSLNPEQKLNDRILEPPVTSIDNWSIDQLVNYLSLSVNGEHSPLAQYNSVWFRHGITGNVFLNLTDDELKQNLGISILGHRKLILKIIDNLLIISKSEKGASNFESTSKVSTTKIPNEFYCPISYQIMMDPVIAADGYSYERESIQAWIDQCGIDQFRSPMSNQILNNKELISNIVLRNMIREMND